MATKIEDLQSQLHCLAGKKLSGADLDAQSNVSNTNKGGIKCKILDWFSKDEVVVGESDNNSPTEHNMDSDEQPIYNIFAWNGTDIVAEAAINYGEMDDMNAVNMILVGIPLDEPHLKNHLSILVNTEKNDLKAGSLPVTESYYLMGTVDPTGELKEDEVCVILCSFQGNPAELTSISYVLVCNNRVFLKRYVKNHDEKQLVTELVAIYRAS
ncbi:uncharacterized protein LOC110224791 isoform X1 [Arabidopsis lyrata subsp. lyrata]|uniref:uncharacterized protein LOC110224791 isoform X1 n=1 Tax=Arabidopsis lyrata subsp. lyrata TaxID=81972 RepID=UPI000A29B948|nr:uncharacterized protein LOC110224791 isoform X1 [Arabidopsis lyrata subsp. lyrata]|eukprot:XP_020867635.1 uncharacterized protein LOC110224791 isoform X1 [Arabidopsis lyrata subsp. lyrata]